MRVSGFRGLWCFERLIRSATGTAWQNLKQQPRARPPRLVVAHKTVAAHIPAHAGRMGSAAADRSPTRRGEAPGTELAFLSVAVQRANARPEDLFIGSWVRARVRLGAVTTSSTAKGHLNPGLTNDDRDEDREGVYGFESPAAPGSSPRKHV